MGNPLSPLMSEIFMANLERKIATNNIMPRVWIRYVDVILATVKEREKEIVLLNQLHHKIKFKCIPEPRNHKVATS